MFFDGLIPNQELKCTYTKGLIQSHVWVSTLDENQTPPTTEDYGLIDEIEAYAMTTTCPLSIQQKCNRLESYIEQVKQMEAI